VEDLKFEARRWGSAARGVVRQVLLDHDGARIGARLETHAEDFGRVDQSKLVGRLRRVGFLEDVLA